jgi:hypothetical protein
MRKILLSKFEECGIWITVFFQEDSILLAGEEFIDSRDNSFPQTQITFRIDFFYMTRPINQSLSTFPCLGTQPGFLFLIDFSSITD